MKLREISKQELKEVLEDHRLWLNNSNEGKQANLRGSDLRGSNLRYSNLRGSDLSGSDLRYSNLSGSDLRDSDLRDSDLSYSDLRGSDLSGSDLRDSNLSGSNLRYSNLRGSDLSGSDLSGSDLRGSDLLTFQYQGHQAYCTGERLIIGCEDKSLLEWSECFEQVGKEASYTDLQIKMYKQFIDMCIEHAATIDRKELT